MATKNKRIELVFGVRDQDLHEWMVQNELNSATAIKNILRAQMALEGTRTTIVPSKAPATKIHKEPENKAGLGGISYKKL